jgi:hypothetical protein
MDERILISIGIAAAYFVLVWLRSRSFNQGRLAGIREAVTDVSRSCSYHYESKDEPLPEKVDKALVYMSHALKRGNGIKGKIDLYLTGSGCSGTRWARQPIRRDSTPGGGGHIRPMASSASTCRLGLRCGFSANWYTMSAA